MAALAPAPLPSLGSLFDATGSGGVAAPAPLPSLSFVLSTSSGRVIPVEVASFAFTGKAATLKSSGRLTSAAGSFAMTGVEVSFRYVQLGLGLSAPVPLPSLSTLFDGSLPGSGMGAAAPLPSMSMLFERTDTDKLLVATKGVFTVTGGDFTGRRGAGLVSECGSFVIEGAPAERDLEEDPIGGSFVVSGSNALFFYSRSPSLSGSYVITFNPATLTYRENRIRAAAGAFVVAPNDANLVLVKHQIGGWRGSGGLYDSGLLTAVKRKRKKKRPVVDEAVDYL